MMLVIRAPPGSTLEIPFDNSQAKDHNYTLSLVNREENSVITNDQHFQ